MRIFLLLLFFILLPPSSESAPQDADTIFLNGNVYTVNEAAPKAAGDRDQGRAHSLRGGEC